MFRTACFLIATLTATAGLAQVPPGSAYDPATHPNPILTYVTSSDFKPSTYAEAQEEADIELLGLSGSEGKRTSIELAAGGTRPATVGAGGEDEAWDVAALAALDIPILQALCLTWSRDSWADSDDGVSPLDSATQIAVPEFDGRIITVPFSFKEFDADGLPRYVTDPERCARVAGIAVAHARLRHVPAAQRRIAIMLSAYPTKHSRVGNAVGLDTPVSAIRLLRAMREQGYDLGEGFPGMDLEDDAEAGNALIHALIEVIVAARIVGGTDRCEDKIAPKISIAGSDTDPRDVREIGIIRRSVECPVG